MCRSKGAASMPANDPFRPAVTALGAVVLTNAGYFGDTRRPSDLVSRRALMFLASRQKDDGSFAEPGDPAPAMTNACAAMALCRALAIRTDRKPMAEVTDRAAARAIAIVARANVPAGPQHLSAVTWGQLALKAAATAGIEFPSDEPRRRLAWIETRFAALELTPGTDARTMTHAWAARAVACLAAGARDSALQADLGELFRRLESGGPAVHDAETILFTAMLQAKLHPGQDPGWAVLKRLIVDTQLGPGADCPAGSWSMPCVWDDVGGRLTSTALMTWALELYYRYPKAGWVGE
jgi:hypothetical protein